MRICALLILIAILGAGLTRSTSLIHFGSNNDNIVLAVPHQGDEALPLTRIAVGAMLDPNAPQPVWNAILDKKPQLFIFMGDLLHSNASADAANNTLASAYGMQERNEGFSRLRSVVPVLPVWNSREYGSDRGTATAAKTDAIASFVSFWHVQPESVRAKHTGFYDAMVFGVAGRRVQIIRLDLSSFRDALLLASRPEHMMASLDDAVPSLDPLPSMLGAEQWKWLEGELKREADLRLIVSSIPILSTAAGSDNWSRLPPERQRLFDLIAAVKANGIVFLTSGDGRGALYRQEDGGPYTLFELAAGSLNHPKELSMDEIDQARLGPACVKANFGIVEIDWPRQTVRLALSADDGTLIEPQASVPLAMLKIADVVAPVTGAFVPGGE